MKQWAAVAATVLLVIATAFGDSGEAKSECQLPPATEIETPSPIAMTLDPNPATAGTMATLQVSDAGLPSDAVVGLGLAWQCWDGSQWIDTHQLVRSVDPFQAQIIVVEPGVTTTIAGLGVALPSIAEILTPDVAPGIYRIREEAVQPGPQFTPGHLIVEVIDGPAAAG